MRSLPSIVALDAVAALVYVLVFGLPLRQESAWALGVQLVSIVLVVGGILLRWRWPIAAFILVSGVTVLTLGLGSSNGAFVAAAWTLYPVALRWGVFSHRVNRAITSLLLGALLVLFLVGTGYDESSLGLALLSILLLGGSWTLGRAVREQRIQTRKSARSAARAAVYEERLRIAREMHDIVSHSLGGIGVQAGVARHIATNDVDELRRVLGEIEKASRSALTDMRVLLGMLRSPEDRLLQPQPSLDDLAGLAAAARSANVSCALTVRGTEHLGGGVQLSVYRIVQEALTNVIRHAPGSRCTVTVIGARHGVEVDVVDDGPGDSSGAEHGGHGLIGMRERASSHGGTFSSGTLPRGGFGIHVWLPAPIERDDDG